MGGKEVDIGRREGEPRKAVQAGMRGERFKCEFELSYFFD